MSAAVPQSTVLLARTYKTRLARKREGPVTATPLRGAVRDSKRRSKDS